MQPSRGTKDREAFCCTGCWVAHRLAPKDEAERTDRLLARIILSAFLSMGVMVFSISLYGDAWGRSVGADFEGEAAEAMRGLFRLGALALTVPILGLLLLPLVEAVVRMRRWLSLESLVVCGVSAAFCVSLWNTLFERGEVYFETVAMVLVLVTLGRWLETQAKRRGRERLTGLLANSVRQAVVLDPGSGAEREVDPGELLIGEHVRVRPGGEVPVDGRILSGRAFVDTSMLTGEAQPRPVAPGDRLLAGMSPLDGALDLIVEQTGGERVRDRIERLLQQAMQSRAPSVRAADTLARCLLPLVLLLAALTLALRIPRVGLEEASLNALSVVLISCPCALGIATPLAFWVALGEAWRHGVLVRGAEVFERLARARRVLFDKTGTLTLTDFELRSVELVDPSWSEQRVLALAAALERSSEHPIGRALVRAWEVLDADALPQVEDFRALPGRGVEGRCEGAAVRLQRADDLAAAVDSAQDETRVELSLDGRPLALFSLGACVRPEAAQVVHDLGTQGLELAVLTGDGPGPAAALSRTLGVPVLHSLLPEHKLERVHAAGAGTLFVGDGLNDVAALAAADVGVAVSSGVERSLEVAAVNLLRPGIAELPGLLSLARRARQVARWNLGWAFSYNVIGLALAATGRLTPVFAAGAMVLSSIAVVLHSRRIASSWPGAEVEDSAQAVSLPLPDAGGSAAG